FTPALFLLGLTLTDQARFGWENDREATYEAALECARRALAADPNCGEAYQSSAMSVHFSVATTRRWPLERRRSPSVQAGPPRITWRVCITDTPAISERLPST